LSGMLARRLGRDAFLEAVGEILRGPDELPVLVRVLGALPVRTIVTTATDDLLERAFERDGVLPNVCTPSDGPDRKGDPRKRLVFKVLGDLARPETLCVTARELERALAAGSGHRAFFEELARHRTLLFVGFDPEDDDFTLLHTRFFAHAEPSETEHFLFLP